MVHKRPNILFIITDHQRADSIGMVQNGREVTPRLNQLAREASHFRRAYSTAPLCVPARTALASGRYPTANGVTINDFNPNCPHKQTFVSQRLADLGYAVAQLGKQDLRGAPPPSEQPPDGVWCVLDDYYRYCRAQGVKARTRDMLIADGFYRQVKEHTRDGIMERYYSCPSGDVWEGAYEHYGDCYFKRHAMSFVEEHANGDQPFALFLALPCPHPPLLVPEPFASRFPPDSLTLPDNVDKIANGEPKNRRLGTAAQLAEGVPMSTHRAAWSAHLGLVNLADELIGELLDQLEELNIADHTTVIFTSDHGHNLGQHRMFGINELYEPTIHVPLIIRTPGGPAQRIDRLAGHLDLVPTMLELCGGEITPEMTGCSLMGTVRDGSPLPQRPMFAQFAGLIAVGDQRRCIVTEDHKYIWDPDDTSELYDLANDPLEMMNLAGNADVATLEASLHEQCKAWHESQNDFISWS